jgi:2',3'-cyclic-nucleotide 2'-phosphodiesterase (5'-nucleotidase family)
VLGLCYRYTPTVTLAANVTHLRFEDDSTTAARLVPELRKRNTPDVVLVVGHIPAETDSTRRAQSGDLPRLAHVPGVDAWFGGHSHNRVLDTVGGVPVMIPGAHGEVIGVCDMVVDPVAHRVVERNSRLVITYADEVTADSAMAARVARWDANVGPLAATPVGRIARPLTRGGGGDSGIGDLVCDAMREASGVDVAFQNSGGLRADLAEGVVTKGAVYEVMPFDNTIFTLELTGAEVRQALEDALRTGRVTQVSGIRYVYDSSRPRGDRVVSVTRADGSPLDAHRLYPTACNNFMATGGDENAVLSQGKNRNDTGRNVRDAIEVYIAARSRNGGALDQAPDGRIQRQGGRTSGGDGR